MLAVVLALVSALGRGGTAIFARVGMQGISPLFVLFFARILPSGLEKVTHKVLVGIALAASGVVPVVVGGTR